jgi:TonB family protein
MRTLIVASLIFLFIAVGGVVGYLYFIAEPKRHPDQPAASTEPETSKALNQDQQVPLPDAAPVQSSQPEKQEIPKADKEASHEEKQEVPEPASQPADIVDSIDIVQPVLIHRVNPEYPEVAKKARIQGVVILEAAISNEGTVESVKVLRGVHPVLDQAAQNAVRKWRYKPATYNGRPVKVKSTVSVNFKLK